MIEENEARRRILEGTFPGAAVSVCLQDAVGRRAARPVSGRVDLPGFDNSAMDGYAVRAGDAIVGAVLQVVGEQPAGADAGLNLRAGQAIRIFTGAPIPEGADAVVMQEDVKRESGRITIREAAEAGEFVRRRGADVCVGQKLIEVGDRIGSGRVALLASQGFDTVEVYERPRVAVVTTGDELRSAGEVGDLRPGEIFNSNQAMLSALATRFGGEMVAMLHATDEVTDLRETLKTALDAADVVLVAGGVSVGERDLVKQELSALEVESDFWRVRVKPGKPFLYGHRGQTQVFGLPGNPVSAFTTFLLFAAPALQRRLGAPASLELPLQKMRVVSSVPVNNRGDRPHYLRGRLDKEGKFSPVGMQQSHAVFGMSRATVMLRLKASGSVAAGEPVEVWRLDDV